MRKNSAKLLRGAGRLYGAKLLFQWRVVENGKAKGRRLCEERVILIRARTPKSALAAAKRYGVKSSYDDLRPRPRGRKVFFEFIGVVDFDDMITDFTEHPMEVWYELRERYKPMERRNRLLVPEDRMRAVYTPKPRRGRIVV
ncbi:MAG TPA: DUF4288 domain-containing protein [Anaeromyxobacteraceae bacterium]|nr:DUF4288 domain-containing protein [Anaeromyxobacteraceae bacterium]